MLQLINTAYYSLVVHKDRFFYNYKKYKLAQKTSAYSHFDS